MTLCEHVIKYNNNNNNNSCNILDRAVKNLCTFHNNNSNTETTLKHHTRTPLQQLQLVSTNHSEAGISANITNSNRSSEAL